MISLSTRDAVPQWAQDAFDNLCSRLRGWMFKDHHEDGTHRWVTFSSVKSPSTDRRTLDDYEEGEFLPTITGDNPGSSGQVYTTQIGRYIKIGRIVYAYGRVITSNKGTINGNVCIGGLPYPGLNFSGVHNCITIGFWSGLATAYAWIGGLVIAGTYTLQLRGTTPGALATVVTLTTANLNNVTDFGFSVTYITDF